VHKGQNDNFILRTFFIKKENSLGKANSLFHINITFLNVCMPQLGIFSQERVLNYSEGNAISFSLS
jgi:hypothetical protein